MFQEILSNLSTFSALPNVMNPYQGDTDTAVTRRNNLHHYLQQMHTRQPTCLLIGEALGYRGGRLTGIPFTSPQILLSHPFFIDSGGFRRPSDWPHIQKEATATIIWGWLTTQSQLPLLWNAFPFHPHLPDREQTNRPPIKAELNAGRPFLQQVCALFPIQKIIAVGRKADAALTKWQMPHTAVRHPSHGGKQAFIAGMDAFFLENRVSG